MDPQDHLRALLDGVTCTVCEDRVPAERVRLLAWRDDLAFLEIDCPACRSTSLGFVLAGGSPDGEGGHPEMAPITYDDVLDMHEFLARWQGDLKAAVARGARPPLERSIGADPRP
jgi:hypothetical protein